MREVAAGQYAVSMRVPPKLIPVFEGEYRYRCSYGGRGSAKTRTFAKMMAARGIMFAQAGIEGVLLCGRQYMNSLDDSSMAEVKLAIREEPWLNANYEIGEKYIRTKDHRISFKFTGLDRNVDSIKSKSRVLIAWIDEAEPVSATAWDKLRPTVREDGSEIWVTWNPETDGSATDTMFRKNPPPDAIIVEMNYSDNPWFPETLRKEMEWDRSTNPEKFSWIWGGDYNKNADSLVFFNKYVVEDFETPTDIERFYYGADWGFSADPSVLVRMFLKERDLYIDHEVYKIGCEVDHLPALFAGPCPNLGGMDTDKHWENPFGDQGVPGSYDWPIVADSARPETISYMRRRGFNIVGAKKGPDSVKDGVEFLKSCRTHIHTRCVHTADEFGSYRYKTDRNTGDVLPILEDKKNHVIDSARYALEGVRKARFQHNKILPILGGNAQAISGGLNLG